MGFNSAFKGLIKWRISEGSP